MAGDSPDQYIQVFNILNFGFSNYVPIFFGTGFLAIIVVFYLAEKSDPEKYPLLSFIKSRWSYGWGGFVKIGLPIAGTVFIFSVFSSYVDYANLRDGMVSGKYELITGKVQNYQPESVSPNRSEKFSVNGHVFEFSSADFTSAFHKTKLNDSPIREDEKVKVYCVQGKIVKLEIRKSDLQPKN
jgi:hypothetical protein